MLVACKPSCLEAAAPRRLNPPPTHPHPFRRQAIDKASIRAADLNTQLRAMAQAAAPAEAAAKAGASQRGGSPGAKDGGRAGAGLQLPGLQDVRGQWGGSIQAYGGGGGATSCDFDVRGQAWQWGAYGLDALVAAGSYHSEEGVALQEVRARAARGRGGSGAGQADGLGYGCREA